MSAVKGLLIGVSLIASWITSTCLLLQTGLGFGDPQSWLYMFLQTHLYTGLFITAHDAMHHSVSDKKKVNELIGWLSAGLFAFNNYRKLYVKHHRHHKYVATGTDPDYYDGNFLSWYLKFLKEYISIYQILLMAVAYNILKIFFQEQAIVMFWMVPSVLSTLQLFTFGTYLPHRKIYHGSNRHHSGSQRKNHLLAFFSCYFFGYHYEHHQSPHIPWWKLYKKK